MTASGGGLSGGESKAEETFCRRGRREEREDVLSSRLGSWRQISVLLSFLGGGSGSRTHLPELGPACCSGLGIVKQIAWWGPGPR